MKPTSKKAASAEAEPEVEAHEIAEPTPNAATGRSGVPWLSVPKLSLPKLSLGRDQSAPTPKAAEPKIPEPKAAEPKAAEPEAAEPEAAEDGVATPPPSKAVAVNETKTAVRRKPRKRGSDTETILKVEGLTKRFDDTIAVNDIDLEVMAGSFYGIVGPNGAGKTTTLSMITGLLRPTAGSVTVHGADVWGDPVVAKRNMGVLPDRLRLFDRLTGAQLLYYAGVLRGMDGATVRARAADLANVFGLEESLHRLVSDYSAGMTKKVALAAAMIHSPRMLVLDEPFESVDPVSAATVTQILKAYVAGGGTVLLSSHSMDLVQRICDFVAVVVDGSVLADGTMESVRNGGSLEERFIELAGGHDAAEGLEWLSSFSD
ncbi:MAG: ABC transporter ATP-binding protein [Rhodoglobus sp.]